MQADGVTQDPNVANLHAARERRAATSSRCAASAPGMRSRPSCSSAFARRSRPSAKTDPDVIAGRALFTAANCQQCHGGPQWTTARVQRSRRRPTAAQVVAGQIIGELRQVGTFDPTAFNEVRQNAAPRWAPTASCRPRCFRSIAFPQTFFHNGAATSLDQVLQQRHASLARAPSASTP